STLFTRTIGQTVGAGLAGAILNFGLSRYAPNAGEVLDLLLDATRRASLDAAQVAGLVDAAANALREVYVVAAVLAVIPLVTALLLPASTSAAQSEAGR